MIRLLRKRKPSRLTCPSCKVTTRYERGTRLSVMYRDQIHKLDCKENQ